jgi:hypothetical protein
MNGSVADDGVVAVELVNVDNAQGPGRFAWIAWSRPLPNSKEEQP